MALQAKKPTINLNFDDPSVKELAQFIQYLSENFKAEPNLPITIKVLECLMFIKLNFPWISYAILNKEKDNTIYKYSQDKAKRVLRAHNDMSFHIIMYKDPEKAISDYRDIITAIENGIDRLLANPAYTKTFIRKIQDSAIGCMEARLDLALNFIIDPSIPKLDDIFQDFFAEQTQLGIESEDIDKFIPHLTKYFAKKLDEEVTHDGKVIPLSWNEVKEYLEKFFGYDEELKPLNLLKDAIINTKDNNYILNFPSQSIAEKYLNLIQLSLPADLYLKLNKINIIKSEIIFNKLKNNNFFYNFQLTQEQFHILAILLDTSVNNLVSQSNIYSLISSLVTALNDDFEEVKSLINCHPALKNFMINKDGELLIHFLVQNNKLEQLKILVEAYQLDINAQIAITNSNRGGMTSVYLACLLDQVNNEILEYLLQAGADVNIPSSAGIMPLEQLVYIPNQASKLKVFLDNSKNLPKSNMSLIYAIEKNDIEVVTQILSIPGIDINYTNSKGESALFVAAKKGDIQKVALLLTFAPIDLETRDETGTTAIQIARDNNHQEVAQLILTQLKNALESKTSSLLRQEHTFVNYALTLHKTPTEDLYIRYLKGLITLNNTQDTTNKVTQLEAHYVMSRKLWSDVVSETYLANLQYSQSYAVKEKVIQRLKEMGVTYPIKTYQDCMAYIREDSVITLSFNAAFLENGLADCQPLNMWQRGEGYRTSSYESIRDNVEKGLFSFLSEDLRTALFDNIEARPRYAACWLPDKNTTRPHASWYGNSFLVLKDVVKLNSIFSPGNAFSYKSRIKQDYKVCTVHNLDLLLLQCHSATLQAIINKVTKGELKADNYDQNVIWEKNKGGHFEAMIPVFHFLNPDFVEHIHIDPNDYVLSAAEKGLIQSRGITVSNSLVPPYEDLSKKFANAKNEHANTLLEKYPLLRKIFTQQKLPTHLAKLKGLLEKLNALAIKNDFRAFNATWNRLEKAGFIKEAKRSVTEYFNIFFGPINFVFEKLIKTKDENITKLFFDSKLMDLDNLLNNFLYPKQGTAENSLFYKYISYGIENKNETFLNVLFNQIPKACQLSFMELFKTDYINCLAKINHFLALKVLIYLKQKNHLSLEQGTITPKSNLLLQAEYAIQILYSLMQDTALSPLETDSLKNCAPELLTNLFQILVRQHPIYEVRNLLNADIFREKMSAQCEEMDQIFYVIYLEKIIFCYQKELEIFALAGTFEKFKEPWEKIFSLYHQDKKQIEKKISLSTK
ncbi:MAG: ankyrin repeat domain-containing protein [Rickettsia endosymbiont of Ixodes persulcatus]|nr:ankyrin repeat domain-containing protein [Rickettsia endosymbiont of Ixodes persulcatus]